MAAGWGFCMTESAFIDFLQRALWLILILSAPILVVNLLVGIAISIFQAVTQIQESTLTFVPKLLTSFLCMVILGPWMTRMIISYGQEVFQQLVVMGRGPGP
jgi:flagellar biosynthetic protein FliQ